MNNKSLYKIDCDGKNIIIKKTDNILAILSVKQNTDYNLKEYAWYFTGIKEVTIDNIKYFDKPENIINIFNELFKKFRDNNLDILRVEIEENSLLTEYFKQISDHYFNSPHKGFICYEKIFSDNYTCYPIYMKPYFRHGEMTPWGGNKLKKLFNKNIPDDRTGESLEISAIENMDSQDVSGKTLNEILGKYSTKIFNKEIKKFPLLLKLLDAKELLSIQVHPDDIYAAKYENGKFGKEEAWVVLDCNENSELIYSVKDSTNKDNLSEALYNAQNPERLLNSVKVNAGDVFYISPGTVHALGSGIVVYEIQQSSDVTYRVWDWNRKDKNGNPRELHIEKALDCIKYDKPFEKSTLPKETGTHKIVDAKAFELYYLSEDSSFIFDNKKDFALLTVLNKTKIKFSNSYIDLNAGESLLIPKNIQRATTSDNFKAFMAVEK